MKYSQIILGKDLYDLDLNDLTQFFNIEKEETLNLEFKSCPATGDINAIERKVLQAICGLLNSEGGIVIWGAPIETRNASGNTAAQGAITPFTTTLDRDKLINKISSLIKPLPVGIRVQKLDDANGDSIFVIEVEKSNIRPHQYKDKYYVRLDGQTKVAPHYIISALMKSVDFPVVRGHLRLRNIDTDGHNLILTFKKLIVNTSKFNNDLNFFIRVVTHPGLIESNGKIYRGTYDSPIVPILSNGRPLLSEFNVIIPHGDLIKNNHELQLVLNFGGEKSPSQTSFYKYKMNGTMGSVSNESTFLLEKKENSLPTNNNKSDDEIINELLDS